MNKTKDAGTREEEVGDREMVRESRKMDPVEGQVVEVMYIKNVEDLLGKEVCLFCDYMNEMLLSSN